MTVKHEIKSQLAKLLATEDLVVEHKKVETAQFNVQTRVLTLPMWEKASNNVLDSLVCHEVGHALYTPDYDWSKDRKIGFDFVNIVEDARIEKLMKRRYAGIPKTFYNGYLELHDNDFFEVEGRDISEFNLADKINLHFKIGNYVDIDFTIEEQLFVERVNRCETFEEVLDVAEDLYKYCKGEMEEDIKEQIADAEEEESMGMDMEGSGSGMDSDSEDGDLEDGEGEGWDQIDMDYQKTQPDQLTIEELHQQLQHSEPKVETADSLAKGIESLIEQGGAENFYVEIPKIDLDKVIISFLE